MIRIGPAKRAWSVGSGFKPSSRRKIRVGPAGNNPCEAAAAGIGAQRRLCVPFGSRPSRPARPHGQTLKADSEPNHADGGEPRGAVPGGGGGRRSQK